MYALLKAVLLLDREEVAYDSPLPANEVCERLREIVPTGFLARVGTSGIVGAVNERSIRLCRKSSLLEFRLAQLQYVGSLHPRPTGCRLVGAYSFTGLGRLLAGLVVGTLSVVAVLVALLAILALVRGDVGAAKRAALAAGVCLVGCVPIWALAVHTRGAATSDRSDLGVTIKLALNSDRV